MARVEISYMSRQGAGIMKCVTGTEDEIIAALSRVKRPATVKYAGQEVGGVFENDGSYGDGKSKWIWWLDLDRERGE